MKKNKKIKIKYHSFIILFLIILGIVFVIKKSFASKEIVINDDFVGLNKSEITELCNKQKLKCEFTYIDNMVDKDVALLKEKIDNKYIITLSSGVLSKELLSEKGVDELGRVPIMMYHGIINTEDNKYTGGNVDKDGYNRTSKAFREDLEFYYREGYRMIRLYDYVNGDIDVELGLSPIILTFDDGNKNNFNVLGRDDKGNLIIDPNSAVGILEEFKKKYPDYHVTATFFVMNNLFNQKEYNEEILNWLVDNGYDIGNHTTIHADFTKIDIEKTKEVVGKMYETLDDILGDKYVNIIALPYGSPYKRSHANYPYILNSTYNGKKYETISALRVGWESEVSPFDTNFDRTFLKRCRAYDNNGKEFDIEMVFKNLKKNRYISDGNKNIVTIKESDSSKLNKSILKEVVKY